MLDNHIHAMQNTIQHTFTAIGESEEHLKRIVENTRIELARVELEFAEVQNRYQSLCRTLDELMFDAELARKQLGLVGELTDNQSRSEVQQAIDHALQIQAQLGQSQERQWQLQVQLEDLSHRIGFLNTMSIQAESMLERFSAASTKLHDTNSNVTSVLEMGALQDALSVRMVEMMEDERRSLAEHLHDGPLQHLASLLMKAEAAYRMNSQSMELGVALDLRGRLNDVIGSIREIVFNLRPPLLDDLGLVPALRWYSSQWSEDTGIETSVNLVGVETSLNHTEKVTLFRVTQAALDHAREHTDTSKVSIHVTYGAGRVMIQVVSDGQEAFVENWLQRIERGQVGLALCRQRLLALGGEFSISSAEPVGTSLNIALPLHRD